MKIWLRWFYIVLTCKLGIHAEFRHFELPNDYILTECSRCHEAIYSQRHKHDYTTYKPSAWDVARGLYDKGIQP